LSAGDEATWGEFVRRCAAPIKAVITKTVHRWGTASPKLVDDLVQDVFIKLCQNDYRALRNFEMQNEQTLFGFLKVVAANVAQDYLRSAVAFKGSGSLETVLLSQVSPYLRGSPPATIENEVFIKEIEQALQAHSKDPNFERDYKIFWLHYRSGFTAKAIARLPGLGLSVKGVESVLLRMTRRVRAALTSPPSKRKNKKSSEGPA
jgi:RNA polymerase sigma-70 factor, ECF subfamily